MDENELRRALHTTMTTAPPPMDSAPVLAAGRRAVRRRAAATGFAAAAVVGVTTVAAAAALQAPAAPVAGPAPAPPSAVPTPTAVDTKPSWPLDGDGHPQQDATARSGPRYEQGATLLEQLLAVVPGGWTTPEGTTAEVPAQYHQAQVGGDNSGSTWEYMAYAAVSKGGRTGELLAEVHTTGNGLPADLCATGRAFWMLGGTCRLVTAGGSKVAVVDGPAGRQPDQWAAYRHPDGTVVYVAQSRRPSSGTSTAPALQQLPLSPQALAALAVQERFHLE
ncbi:hypothetical protein [Actinoplanes sp. RD1]|uniref:hypothetical protein n=1 Tax=Actinoplanes sp. RD1 TaxID=3064538 RepID=UPI0027414D04|nr:hypothetical protein [Actinoplanes sp. RD1]